MSSTPPAALNEARQKLALFDNQPPRALGDWQAPAKSIVVSNAALESAKKKLAEMGAQLPLGEGWARRVYEDEGQALKIATGPRGIQQNAAEVMLSGRSSALNRLVGYAADYAWVRQKLATPFESAESMGKHLGMSEHPEFDQWLRDVVMLEQAPVNLPPRAQELWDTLQQLYREVPELDPRDLGKYQQWGLDKYGKLVLIDYGFLKGMPVAVAGGIGSPRVADAQ